jgi:hypothetical protein
MTWVQRCARIAPAMISVVAGASCSGGGGGPTQPAVNSGSFSLIVSPPSTQVTPGTAIAVDVTVTRSGGLAGAVNLSVSGLPAGVSSVLNPVSVQANSSGSALTLTAAATVSRGCAWPHGTRSRDWRERRHCLTAAHRRSARVEHALVTCQYRRVSHVRHYDGRSRLLLGTRAQRAARKRIVE